MRSKRARGSSGAGFDSRMGDAGDCVAAALDGNVQKTFESLVIEAEPSAAADGRRRAMFWPRAYDAAASFLSRLERAFAERNWSEDLA